MALEELEALALELQALRKQHLGLGGSRGGDWSWDDNGRHVSFVSVKFYSCSTVSGGFGWIGFSPKVRGWAPPSKRHVRDRGEGSVEVSAGEARHRFEASGIREEGLWLRVGVFVGFGGLLA